MGKAIWRLLVQGRAIPGRGSPAGQVSTIHTYATGGGSDIPACAQRADGTLAGYHRGGRESRGSVYGPIIIDSAMTLNALETFPQLWDSTVKSAVYDRYGWETNPWVWAYTFKKIKVCTESVGEND